MVNMIESIGEDLIADFLEESVITFERNKFIPQLKDDDKFFREADFYLPDYGVYLEFLGLWNNPADKVRYKQKMAVYHKNKIPCIYIWPDNLGTLNWMFKRRLRETLLKYDLKRTLFKFEWESFQEENGGAIAFFVVLIYIIDNLYLRILLGALFVRVMYLSVKKYTKRLSKLKKSKWVTGANYSDHKLD